MCPQNPNDEIIEADEIIERLERLEKHYGEENPFKKEIEIIRKSVEDLSGRLADLEKQCADVVDWINS